MMVFTDGDTRLRDLQMSVLPDATHVLDWGIVKLPRARRHDGRCEDYQKPAMPISAMVYGNKAVIYKLF